MTQATTETPAAPRRSAVASVPAGLTSTSANPARPRVDVDDPILRAEYEHVLDAFDEAKKFENCELRVTIQRDPRTGYCEIIYAGLHQKRSLDVLRKVYRSRAKDPSNGVIRR